MCDEFTIDINHLSLGSNAIVDVLCDYCSNTVVAKTYTDYQRQNQKQIINKDCCVDCRGKKTAESMLVTYGTSNVMHIAGVPDKMRATIRERYGVDNVAHSDVIQEKKKQTCQEKYGVDNQFQDEGVKAKIVQTNLSKYGVANYSQTDEYTEKYKQTSRQNHGTDWPMQNADVKAKGVATNLEKYGVENVFQSEEIKERIMETLLDRYGVAYASQMESHRDAVMETSRQRYGTDHPMQNADLLEKRTLSSYQNGTCPTSRPQMQLYEVLGQMGFNVELNYPVGRLNLDVALFHGNYKIDVEYDGIYWHQNTQHRDMKRDYWVKSEGWKVLRIRGNYLIPNIDELRAAIDMLITTDIRHFSISTIEDTGEIA